MMLFSQSHRPSFDNFCSLVHDTRKEKFWLRGYRTSDLPISASVILPLNSSNDVIEVNLISVLSLLLL